MKARRPSQTRDPEIVDQIVEDLGQQDVLPAGPDTDIMSPHDAEMIAEEQAGRWDEPVGAQGHQAKRMALEDETKSSEMLVQRGVTEAAEELRELDDEEASPEEAE